MEDASVMYFTLNNADCIYSGIISVFLLLTDTDMGNVGMQSGHEIKQNKLTVSFFDILSSARYSFKQKILYRFTKW
jgi:hypothetical protein